MPIFQRARNFVVNHSIFNDGGKLDSLQHLSLTIAPSAIHKSSERYPPPQCLPGTREDVISLLLGRCKEPSRFAALVWLCGSGGTGKSAIAQTVAQSLEASDALGATFFFLQENPSLNDPKHLFSTLAYQLAVNIPSLKESIADAVASNPNIVNESPENQLSSLIIKPLHSCSSRLKSRIVIIIDGLNECSNAELVIVLLLKLVRTDLPIVLVVTSRPGQTFSDLLRPHDKPKNLDDVNRSGTEGQVDDTLCEWESDSESDHDRGDLDNRSINGHTGQQLPNPESNGQADNDGYHQLEITIGFDCAEDEFLVIDAESAGLRFDGNEAHSCLELKHTPQVDDDIRLYLRNGFGSIRRHSRHRHTMGDADLDWPSEEVLERLVHKALGQFKRATDILKYVRDEDVLSQSATPSTRIAEVLDKVW